MEKPICPGCGSEMDCELMKMTFRAPYTYEAEWRCRCGWKGPRETGDTREEAVQRAAEATNRRLLQKPLELETVKGLADGAEVYLEARVEAPYCSGYIALHHAAQCEEAYYCGDDDGYMFEHQEYGKAWRAWDHKPTQKERDAAPWDGWLEG